MRIQLISVHKKAIYLAKLFVGLFTVSVFFPLIACFANIENEVNIVSGIFDVAIAALCFVLFLILSSGNKLPADSISLQRLQKINHFLLSLPLLLIAVFFSGITLNWQVLLIGLGWRVWLLSAALPYLVTVFMATAKKGSTP